MPFGEARLLQLCWAAHGQLWNAFVVDKMMMTAFPLCMVLMELSVQLHGLGAALNLGWVPCEQNVVTNEDFSAFDGAKRLRAVLLELGFQVIARLMAAGC